MRKSRHDRIVDRLASKFGSTHRREGVDILVKDMAIEVAATLNDVYQSMAQLKKSRKRRKFLSIPKEFKETALSITKGTGIGVMDGTGKIIKRTRRKKR